MFCAIIGWYIAYTSGITQSLSTSEGFTKQAEYSQIGCMFFLIIIFILFQ